jgi:glycerol kinase
MSDVCILAIDQGTTNTKALLVDRTGAIVARASRPVGIRYPQPGWVEQDPRELYRSVQEASAECLAQASDVKPAAIGISNQRESVVVWDRATGEPVGPCITWQCRRTTEFCEELRARGVAEVVRERSGLTLDPLFSASKARWLLDRAKGGDLCIGTVDSWLLWNLTGGANGQIHATDYTNASRTQLYGLNHLGWDYELMNLFGISRAALPLVYPSSNVYGYTADGVPIAALIGDSHAALFGHGIVDAGPVKATYGTGSSLMTIADAGAVSTHGLSRTIGWAWQDVVRYALEGNISNTGGAVQWVGEFLGLASPADDAASLAESVSDAAGVYLVPAFAGLGAPYWDASARGVLTGLTRGATAAHAARAAIEAIAFQVRGVFEAMEQDLGGELSTLLADGGATRNDSLMQFQADILGRPVMRSESADVSALGAAQLAGLAVGVWSSMEEVAALPRPRRCFEPRMGVVERQRRYDGWREAVDRARSRKD